MARIPQKESIISMRKNGPSKLQAKKEQYMYYVYIIRSIRNNKNIYKGFTADLKQRILDHNNKFSRHTSKNAPWELIFYAAFKSKTTALKFEKYLKTASGIAFLRERLILGT